MDKGYVNENISLKIYIVMFNLKFIVDYRTIYYCINKISLIYNK